MTYLKAKRCQVIHSTSDWHSEKYTKCLRIRSVSHIVTALVHLSEMGLGSAVHLTLVKWVALRFVHIIGYNSVESQAAGWATESRAITGTGGGGGGGVFLPLTLLVSQVFILVSSPLWDSWPDVCFRWPSLFVILFLCIASAEMTCCLFFVIFLLYFVCLPVLCFFYIFYIWARPDNMQETMPLLLFIL